MSIFNEKNLVRNIGKKRWWRIHIFRFPSVNAKTRDRKNATGIPSRPSANAATTVASRVRSSASTTTLYIHIYIIHTHNNMSTSTATTTTTTTTNTTTTTTTTALLLPSRQRLLHDRRLYTHAERVRERDGKKAVETRRRRPFVGRPIILIT